MGRLNKLLSHRIDQNRKEQALPLTCSSPSCSSSDLLLSLLLLQAERFQALEDQLQQSRLQLSLAELYANEREIEACSRSLGDKQQAAAETSTELENLRQTLKTSKKEHGRLTREQQQAEKDMRCVCVWF